MWCDARDRSPLCPPQWPHPQFEGKNLFVARARPPRRSGQRNSCQPTLVLDRNRDSAFSALWHRHKQRSSSALCKSLAGGKEGARATTEYSICRKRLKRLGHCFWLLRHLANLCFSNMLKILPNLPSDFNTGNGTEGTMVCTSLGSLLRPLFYFMCSNLKANPVVS